jgi:DNA-binding response OmpR family regulator
MINVFIAHSNPKIIDLYQPHFEKHFAVDSATNGLIALRKIKLNRPKLIISDVRLPLLSGLGLLRYVRSEPSLSAVPFLFLAHLRDFEQALNYGASDFIEITQASPELLLNKSFYHLKINKDFLKGQ